MLIMKNMGKEGRGMEASLEPKKRTVILFLINIAQKGAKQITPMLAGQSLVRFCVKMKRDDSIGQETFHFA